MVIKDYEALLVLIYRIKQIINHETVSGVFALLSMIIVTWNWLVAVVLMGLSIIHWRYPIHQDHRRDTG